MAPRPAAGPDEARRVGLLVPSSNTVMETDFARTLPAHHHLHTARMFMEDTTVEGENAMLDDHALPAARALGTARPDVVVFGCTSAGALRGNDFDAELVEDIGRATGSRGVSVIRSVREAVAATGARRLGVVTPYIDVLNDRIRASLEADGHEVVDIRGLGIDENFTIAQVPVDDITAFTVDTFGDVDIDLLFASCTNFRALEARDDIAAALGVPVVTSNQATIEAVGSLLADLG